MKTTRPRCGPLWILLSVAVTSLTSQAVCSADDPRPGFYPDGVRAPVASISEDDAGSACDRDSGEVKEVNRLLKDVESNHKTLKTADDFIKILPESIRSSLQFSADSKSIQESNVQNPRVILKSPNSEVMVSFNTGSKLRGFDSVELEVWNPKERRFDLTELRFPGDSDDPAIQSRSNAQVGRDPRSCVTCHGGGAGSSQSARPIFDPYRQWAGFVPFSEDRLNKGSPEVVWYKNYLNQIEKGDRRMRWLKPPLKVEDIDKHFLSNDSIQISSAHSWSSQPVNTPSLDMSHQLLRLNGCRIVGDLLRQPDKWNRIKYALTGALQRDACLDPTVFLSQAQNQRASDWFIAHGIPPAGTVFSFDKVVQDTQDRENHFSDMREENERWFLEKSLGSASAAEATIALADRNDIRGRGRSGPNSKGYVIDDPMITSKSRFPTFENSFQEISKVRYILDPMGFQSNLWSMAGDPDTFAHVEFFKEIAAQPEVQKIWSDAGQDCSRLAELSRAALRDFNALPPALVSYCPPAALKAQAIGDLSRLTASMTLVLARNPVAQALRGCIGCHLAGIEGAPKIPFGNLNQMEKLIANRKGNPGDLGEIIWDRITRSPDSYNSMPLGGAPLSDESKRAVREWLELIPAREK